MQLTLFLVLAFATYRLARFVVLDTIIDEPRDKIHFWLMGRERPWAIWLGRTAHELLSCPACLTVWVAAATTGFTGWLVVPWFGWGYLIWWPAVAGASYTIWTFVDTD